jgi:hypothetical protein
MEKKIDIAGELSTMVADGVSYYNKLKWYEKSLWYLFIGKHFYAGYVLSYYKNNRSIDKNFIEYSKFGSCKCFTGEIKQANTLCNPILKSCFKKI